MTSSTLPTITDVTLEELEADPYPFYAKWREESPVVRVEAIDQVLITRWADCERIGADATRVDTHSAIANRIFGPHILTMGGDAHTHLRKAVDAPLRPKAVRSYVNELVRPVAREYVETIRGLGRLDATTELLELISVRVVGNIIGIGAHDDLTLQRWFQHMNLGLNNFGRDEAAQQLADTATSEVDAFTKTEMDRLLTEPNETSLSHLLHTATPDGKPRAFEDLIGTIRILILGGMQEPGHGAAAALYGLLTQPEQAQAVTNDPGLLSEAIQEGLRWIPPFQAVQRRLLEDFDFDGVIVPAGTDVQVMIASANRDPAHYSDPDTFNIYREPVPIASFGYGAHYCAGHFLARAIASASLEEIFAQLPNIRLDPERPAKVTGFGVRGVKNLPVVWDV
ncbi:MAG TPA: cytochrome P450 [Pseudolysinimonas sp.]|nr:cytochrome P450 [Pseudolysinimonas sp.]